MQTITHRRFERSESNPEQMSAFASDISSLKDCMAAGSPWMQMMEDGRHRGFEMEGHRETIRFRLSGIQRKDGDLQWWQFDVMPEDLERANGITSAVIYND